MWAPLTSPGGMGHTDSSGRPALDFILLSVCRGRTVGEIMLLALCTTPQKIPIPLLPLICSFTSLAFEWGHAQGLQSIEAGEAALTAPAKEDGGAVGKYDSPSPSWKGALPSAIIRGVGSCGPLPT